MSQPARPGGGGTAPSRRERTRAATVAEIKQLAWQQMAEVGAAALSLRGIASEMGMTSSALYRYFESRNDLLNELVVDGFSSLADALEAAEAELDDNPETSRWLHLASAHRRWALEHPTEYALIYGTPVPGLGSGTDERHAQMKRGVNVLFRCMMKALASGEIDASGMEATITPALRKRLQHWRAQLGINLPPAALAGCLFAWTQLHGAVSLELSGHLAPEFQPADDLFDQQMRQVLVLLGSPRPSKAPRPLPKG
jgi:AcrR family transcriptional regulator